MDKIILNQDASEKENVDPWAEYRWKKEEDKVKPMGEKPAETVFAPNVSVASKAQSVKGENFRNAENGHKKVTDENEAAAVKASQAMQVVNNQLLGSFNKVTGKYEVSPAILKELKDIIKQTERKVGDSYYCASISDLNGFGALSFVVQIEDGAEERVAKLHLLETIESVGGLVENTNIFYIDKFVGDKDLQFELKMFKAFNIVDDIRGMSTSEIVNRSQITNILKRKYYLLAMKKKMTKEMELPSAELLEKRMEALKKTGEYGTDVMERYQSMMKQAEERLGRSLSASEKNDALMNAMNGSGLGNAILEKVFNKDFNNDGVIGHPDGPGRTLTPQERMQGREAVFNDPGVSKAQEDWHKNFEKISAQGHQASNQGPQVTTPAAGSTNKDLLNAVSKSGAKTDLTATSPVGYTPPANKEAGKGEPGIKNPSNGIGGLNLDSTSVGESSELASRELKGEITIGG